MTTSSPATGDRHIGAILIDSGKLTLADAERILRLRKDEGLRFGDAAIKLGLLTESDVAFALARQYDYPYLVTGDGEVSSELIAAYQPFSPQVEALRALRSQLMLRWFTGDPEHKALAIVSPGRREGRSGLAASFGNERCRRKTASHRTAEAILNRPRELVEVADFHSAAGQRPPDRSLSGAFHTYEVPCKRT